MKSFYKIAYPSEREKFKDEFEAHRRALQDTQTFAKDIDWRSRGHIPGDKRVQLFFYKPLYL